MISVWHERRFRARKVGIVDTATQTQVAEHIERVQIVGVHVRDAIVLQFDGHFGRQLAPHIPLDFC